MKTHGLSHIPEHTIWKAMIDRCYNKNDGAYSRYGGRGILICDEWLGGNGFVSFYNDMGNRPSKKHSIDRINNSKGYCKENCRWATREEQANNKSNNLFVIYNGKPTSLNMLAKEHGVGYKIAYKRYRNGWSVERIINEPIKGNMIIEFEGIAMNVADWSRRTNISASAIRKRILCGWPVSDVLTKISERDPKSIRTDRTIRRQKQKAKK